MAVEAHLLLHLCGGLVGQDDQLGYEQNLFWDPETLPFQKISVSHHGILVWVYPPLNEGCPRRLGERKSCEMSSEKKLDKKVLWPFFVWLLTHV